MSESGFPEASRPGELPKITKLADFSAEALGQLVQYLNMNVQVPLNQIIGYKVEGRIYDRSASTVDVVSSVVETPIYSKLIAPSDMGVDRMLRLTIGGDYLHNNAAGDQFVLRVKFGGTTFFANSVSNLGSGTSATRHPWVLDLRITNLGLANSQAIFGSIQTERADQLAPTTGIGGALQNESATVALAAPLGASALGTIDTTVGQTLEITAQWGTSSANNSWRKRHAILELI